MNSDAHYWKSKIHIDKRGTFQKILDYEHIPSVNNFIINDIFITESKQNVIRGMHLMLNKHSNNRIIHVIDGSINDVLVDLRSSKKSYLNINAVIMGGGRVDTVFIPAGIAHGFSTTIGAKILYLSDQPHNQDEDFGFHPFSFNYNWKIKNPILSDRDSKLPNLEAFLI
jgi:dTDP-4-dehydrorhamnose 3,5-epimerase